MGLDFDYTGSEYAAEPDHADYNFGSGDFAIVGWVRFATVDFTADLQIFCSQYNSNSGINQIAFYFGYFSSNMRFIYDENGASAGAVSVLRSWSPTAGPLYMVGVTRIGNDLKLYLDGAQLGATHDITGITIHNSTQDFRLSTAFFSGGTAGGFVDGTLSDFRVIKGAGWTDEQMAIFHASLGNDNMTDNVVSRWLMNEKPTGTASSGSDNIIDISGEAHQMTQVNTPTYDEIELRLTDPITM